LRIGYARVSTLKAEQDTSIESQVQQLTAAGCDRVIAERRSAYKDGRPGWEELWQLVAKGEVTEVITIDQSRLSRSGDDLTFLNACHLKGVTVRALTGGIIETETYGGFITAGVLSLMNAAQSKLIGAKVKQGVAARRAAGATAIGKCPFGYRYNGTGPEPDPEQWDAAKDLWAKLRAHEFRVPHVIRLYRLSWSAPGLYRWVKNPMLAGFPVYTDATVEPLVPVEEWQQAQRLFEQRRKVHSRGLPTAKLLSGILRCQQCGRGLSYQYSSGKARLKCQHLGCQWYGRGLAEWKVRNQLIAVLREAVPQMVALVELATRTTDIPQTAEQKQARQQLDQLLHLQGSGVEGLDTAISELRLKLRPVTSPAPANWTGLAEVLRTPGVLEGMTDLELRAVILELIDEMVYVGDPSAVEIRLR
jgi:DNA invertase Pin-like site-specific DNA recombinase